MWRTAYQLLPAVLSAQVDKECSYDGSGLARPLSPSSVSFPALFQRNASRVETWMNLCMTRAWGIECPFCAVTINSCWTGTCRNLTDGARIWRRKVLLENISPKKDFMTRFACDKHCVVVDGILCDFRFGMSWLVL